MVSFHVFGLPVLSHADLGWGFYIKIIEILIGEALEGARAPNFKLIWW